MNRRQIGLLGEWQAAVYARRQGMRIVKRRFRAGHGEIDLIAWDGSVLVFIEVKARPRGGLLAGARAVDAEKRRNLRDAARMYLSAHPANDVRFDVMEITAAGIRHIKNAF